MAENQTAQALSVQKLTEEIERNAMAILFLKQSTSPVLTGK